MIERRGHFDLIVLGTTNVSRWTSETARQAGLRTKRIVRTGQASTPSIDRSEECVWSVIAEASGGFRVDVMGADGPRYYLADRIAAEAMPIEIFLPVPDWTLCGVTWRDEIPRLLGANMHFLPDGDGEAATTDLVGRSSVTGLYAIPRKEAGARELGAQIARDAADEAPWPTLPEALFDEPEPPVWAKHLSELPSDAPVCRYETHTIGDVKTAINAGARDLNQLKHFTRMGMGVCQGRPCEEVTAWIMARTLGVPRSQVGRWTMRPPLDIIDLAGLAGTFSYADIPIPGAAPL